MLVPIVSTKRPISAFQDPRVTPAPLAAAVEGRKNTSPFSKWLGAHGARPVGERAARMLRRRGGDPEVAMARLLIETDDGRLVEVVDELERYDLAFLPAAASILNFIREAEKRAGIELKVT